MQSLWFNFTCQLICFRFIKGFITRNQPSCIDNSEYLAYVRQSYLTRLMENLPKTVLEKDSWPTAPPIMQEVGDTFLIPAVSDFKAACMSTLAGDFGNSCTVFFLGFPALEEALHSPHGMEVCSGNHPTEESTGTAQSLLHTHC